MGGTDEKVGYQKSSYPGITPDIAASGVEEALKVLEGRWKLIILFYLFRDGTLRLSELERAIPGITQKMLVQQLRSLERDGVVSRFVHPVVPPKVEYTLTEMAQELHQSLLELTDWARRHGSAVAAAQAAYDREQIPALPALRQSEH